jgi:hypothetical protein
LLHKGDALAAAGDGQTPHRRSRAAQESTMNAANAPKALGLALLLALPFSAQAGRSEASTALTQAASGLAAAERTGALQHASVELNIARDLLMQAERHCERRDWDNCERAARRAHADARLAEARTRQFNAESATVRIESAIQTLRIELERQGA